MNLISLFLFLKTDLSIVVSPLNNEKLSDYVFKGTVVNRAYTSFLNVGPIQIIPTVPLI